ncbi:hypothetical protein GGS26DRAFT_591827 [Hypomontagnella submonticulosa]|nr:hypothetical protein GGS26DRAFT_591827 [Hypomontagnella submonticulosa]
MESVQKRIEGLREAFVKEEALSGLPEVVAIFLGGSRVYGEESYVPQERQGSSQTQGVDPRDWDGVIIVNTKHDIFTLVNEHRQGFMDLLRIEEAECSAAEFSPCSHLWPELDAVRFVGFGKSRDRRSVIILSWEYFVQVVVYDAYGTPIDIFCKQSPYAEEELEGAILASVFYPRVQIPRISTSGRLLYPLFRGITESEIRLRYVQEGRNDWNDVETLLYMEMVKAEDTLRAYKKSLAPNSGIGEGPDYKLQRLFHQRLIDDTRLRDFYDPTVPLMSKLTPRDEFLGMGWIINEIQYPSLRELYDETASIVESHSSQMSSCPIVCGLGNAHGGNVMTAFGPSRYGGRGILFIDYDVADLHPVMLDLAKPLYTDVFFESLYREVISPDDELDINCRIADNTIVVEFTPKVDWLSQTILDVKMRYLLRPLSEEVQNKFERSLEENVLLLSSAMFLCATLTRKFAKDEKAFLLNFATGITLAGAENWKDLYARFARLGFRLSADLIP